MADDKFYDPNIDTMKGICIIFMVLGHSFFPLSRFIYLFHMPVFFIIAGYCYKERYSSDLRSVTVFIKKRVRSLWLPYFLYNAAFLFLHNLFLRLDLLAQDTRILDYTDVYDLRTTIQYTYDIKDHIVMLVKMFLFGAEETFGGAGWFLRVLFAISILFCFFSFIFGKFCNGKDEIAQLIVSIFFLGGGYCLYLIDWNYENIPAIFSCYILFYLGAVVRKKNLLHYYLNDTKIFILLTMASFLCLVSGLQIGSIDLIKNSYTDPLFLLAMSSFGWIVVYNVSYIMKNGFIKKMLVYVGQRTIPIIFLHFIGFKLITLIQIYLYGLPPFLLAAHPVLIHNNGWWILYGICGVSLPLLFDRFLTFLRYKVKDRSYCHG